VSNIAERINEKICGGTRAYADDLTIDHVAYGGVSYRLLEFILRHGELHR
jgi:hypothetical protein